MTSDVALQSYWHDKLPASRKSGSFPPPPDNPEALAKWEKAWNDHNHAHGEIEAKVWQTICDEARSGRIEIWAYRNVSKPERRGWYPEYPESTDLERIPEGFFANPAMVAFAPMPPFVIYYTDPTLGGIFNAPWRSPKVRIGKLSQPAQKRHTRSLAEEDASIVEQMHDLVTSGECPSPWKAAMGFADKAVGVGTYESKHRRLVDRYKSTYEQEE